MWMNDGNPQWTLLLFPVLPGFYSCYLCLFCVYSALLCSLYVTIAYVSHPDYCIVISYAAHWCKYLTFMLSAMNVE